jgi:hypothetical protein
VATPYVNDVPTTELDLDGLPVALAALIDGAKWGAGGYGSGVDLTYSFPTAARYAPNYGTDNEWFGWSVLNPNEQAAVGEVLAGVARGADITFTLFPDNGIDAGELRFTVSSSISSYAHAYTPYRDYPESGDVWFSGAWTQPGDGVIQPGSYEYMTIVHEVGHALGLRHPFDQDDGLPYLPPELDNYLWTAMSYSAYAGADQYDYADFYPTTLMYLDLVALEEMYGPSTSANPGPTTYTFHSNQQYWETINDSSGVDTIVYDSPQGGSFIDLSNNQFSRMGLAVNFYDELTDALVGSTRNTIGFGPSTIIENATGGGGNDTLIGNGAANRLIGNGGNDRLVGAAGNDNLVGGAGVDRLLAGPGDDRLAWQGSDTLVDGGPGYSDVLKLSGSLNLTAVAQNRIVNVERIDMTGGVNTLTLNAADILDLSTASNTVRVLGDAADVVNIAGAFTDTGYIGGGFHRYTVAGGGILLVDVDITNVS